MHKILIPLSNFLYETKEYEMLFNIIGTIALIIIAIYLIKIYNKTKKGK